MAYFDYIKQTRNANEKLEDAVKENNVGELQRLVREGVNPNTYIHKYGNNTPIQLAATLGYYRCVEVLIEAGVDCDQTNAFEISPLFNAARRDHVMAMRIILRHSLACKGLDSLWYDGRWTEFLHNSASDEVLSSLVIATPDVNSMRENLTSNILCRCFQRKYFKTILAFFSTGYHNDLDCYREKLTLCLQTDTESSEKKSILSEIYDLINAKSPKSLQELCRVVIRRSMHGHYNVFYGGNQLCLPNKLKSFIVFYTQ